MTISRSILKVMIIGENKLTERVIDALVDININVICKPDAAEAVNMFNRENFDVTLIDAYIKHLEEVCHSINYLDRTYTALLINGTPEDFSLARSLNMDSILYEEFDAPGVIEKIYKMILRRKDRENAIKALIIEDEPYIARAISVSLRKRWPRAEIHHAAYGKLGIRLARSKQLDIILLDIKLPDINGFEVLKAIRSFCSTPIIMTTADKVQDDVIKSVNSGANDYLIKPFKQEELIYRIRKNIE